MAASGDYSKMSGHVREMKSKLKDMLDLKQTLVDGNYSNEADIQKVLKLKQRCHFLVSRLTSASRHLHQEVYLEEEASKQHQKSLGRNIEEMEEVSYEKAQVLRKVAACKAQKVDFTSMSDIDVNNYKAKHSDMLNEESEDNLHKFYLKMLKEEKDERQTLLNAANSLKTDVTSTEGKNRDLDDKIQNSLEKKLKSVIAAAAPLREAFDLPRPVLKEPRDVKHLPEVLYAIFYSCWCQKYIHRDLDANLQISVLDVPASVHPNKRRKGNNKQAIPADNSKEPLHPVKLCLQFTSIGMRLILQFHKPSCLILARFMIRTEAKWVFQDPKLFFNLFPRHYQFQLPADVDPKYKFAAFSWLQSLVCEYLPPRQIDNLPELVDLRQILQALHDRILVQRNFISQVKQLQKEKTFDPQVNQLFPQNTVSTISAFDMNKDLKGKYYELSNVDISQDSGNNDFFSISFQHGNTYLRGIIKHGPGYPQHLPSIRVEFLTTQQKLSTNALLNKTSDKAVLEAAMKRKRGYENSAKNIEIAVNGKIREYINKENEVYTFSIMIKLLQQCFDKQMAQKNTTTNTTERKMYGKDMAPAF